MNSEPIHPVSDLFELRDRIVQLGDTAPAVAASLEALGVRGSQTGPPGDCPLSNFTRSLVDPQGQGDFRVVTLLQSFPVATDEPEYHETVVVLLELPGANSPQHFELPWQFLEFIYQFDSGAYPQIVEPARFRPVVPWVEYP